MKNLFSFPLYVQGLKRIRALGFVIAVSVIFINLIGIGKPHINTVGECYYCWKDVSHYGFLTSSFVIVLVVLAPLLTYSMFSYLNKRSGADFYHSLPQKRLTVFISQWLAVLTWLFATVIASVSVNHVYWVQEGGVIHFYVWFNTIVCLCTLVLVFSACTALGVMLAGTALSSVCSVCAVIGIPPLIMNCFQDALESAFPRIVTDKTVLKYIGADNFLPTRLFMDDITGRNFEPDASLLLNLVFALAIVALACLAYSKRKSETASRPASGAVSQHILRGAVTISVVLNGLYTLSAAEMIPLALLVYLLYELLATRSFKCALKALPWFLTVVAAVAVFIGSIAFTNAVMRANDPTNPTEIESLELYGNFNVENVLVQVPDGIVITDDAVFKSLSENYAYDEDQPNRLNYPATVKVNYKSGKSVYRKLVINEPLSDAIGAYVMGDAELCKLVYPLPDWEDIIPSECNPPQNKELWDTFTREYYKLGVGDRYMVRARAITRDYEYISFDIEYDMGSYTERWRFYADAERTGQTYKLLTEGA